MSAASAKTITIDYTTTATDSFPTFTAADISTNAQGAWSKLGDMDNDGDLDIVSANATILFHGMKMMEVLIPHSQPQIFPQVRMVQKVYFLQI